MKHFSDLQTQKGAALVVSLLILLVVTMVGLAGMRTSTQELRMASNAEDKQTASQQAQAAIDYLVNNPSLLPVIGGVGFALCTTNETKANGTACDTNDVELPDPFCDDATTSSGCTTNQWSGTSKLRLTRQNPGTGLPPRLLATSSAMFASAYYLGESQYDATGVGRGADGLGAGLMRIIPK
ncbi:PilX N-terminal domain-containing pilus assembly protein [Methylocaldum sp.]|uniref:PilX N-terminal domain-containing pilus assembly protein n=1 Tax=Methylocaldum sp. TaxID=1969727 RepID=UPI002D2A3C24|nr:PilX N-terminal domain-containing pilus assembly protein [Methylocaldum sp.]HYE35759.1 PilX N-terminal domain-containing pilus assembly protein [Methylocaldum sp.]